jgi:hypothetical protein
MDEDKWYSMRGIMHLKEGEERRGRSSKHWKDDFDVDTSIKRLGGMAQSVGRRGTCWTAWVRLPAEARGFSLVHSVQTESEAHPACSSLGSGGKAAGGGGEADYSATSSFEIKNTSTPTYVFMT